MSLIDLVQTSRCLHPRTGLTRWAATAGLGLLAVGCQILPEAQPDPTRYFLLAAPAARADASAGSDAATEGATIGLRPIELPAYLRNTKSLVVARGSNELAFRDYDRWAEPLELGLSRVLRDGLANSHNVKRVVTFPFGVDQVRDVDLTLRITHCEGAELASGRRVARFALMFEISRAGAGGELLRRGSYTAPDAPWDGEAASLAALLGEAATTAAHAVAAELP